MRTSQLFPTPEPLPAGPSAEVTERALRSVAHAQRRRSALTSLVVAIIAGLLFAGKMEAQTAAGKCDPENQCFPDFPDAGSAAFCYGDDGRWVGGPGCTAPPLPETSWVDTLDDVNDVKNEACDFTCGAASTGPVVKALVDCDWLGGYKEVKTQCFERDMKDAIDKAADSYSACMAECTVKK
jgi:hypothetical protein